MPAGVVLQRGAVNGAGGGLVARQEGGTDLDGAGTQAQRIVDGGRPPGPAR